MNATLEVCSPILLKTTPNLYRTDNYKNAIIARMLAYLCLDIPSSIAPLVRAERCRYKT